MAVDHLELAQLEGFRGGDGCRSDGQSAGEPGASAHCPAVMEVVGMAAARVAETAARAPRWWKLEGGKFRNAGTNESW